MPKNKMEKPNAPYPRLFVALPLPADIVLCFRKLESRLPGLHFQASLHITLRFIGNVVDLESCAHCLEKVLQYPFKLSLGRLGYFRDRILLARLESSKSLISLKSVIDANLKEIGVPADNKIYKPHITLSRLRRPPSWQEKERIKNISLTGEWRVTHFNLYRSLCEAAGAIHILEKSYQLDPLPEE